MSKEYDEYLEKHKHNVTRGYIWLRTNLPKLFDGKPSASWQIDFNHDQSKYNLDEYAAYDAYFYGGNRSHAVVEAFQKAWLLHLHRNPHHWQYWVLINDDPDEGEVLLEMPYNYIIEMICDWWSFSWQKGNLSEIFNWYDEHSAYIKLAPKTREIVEDILWEIRGRLGYNVIAHHGIKGQKWGVRNGPPYPLDRSKSSELKNAAGKSIIKVEHTSITGTPDSISQVTNKKGGIDRNYYGSDGKQTKQISNNNHGHPKAHNYGEHGEHAHDYIYDDSGKLVGRPIRELNDKERKENGDIL